MGFKLFPSRHVITRDEMTSPDPCRQSTDFSSPAHQEKAHSSAGYEKAGASDKSADSTLVLDSDEKFNYRHQNGTLWRKAK